MRRERQVFKGIPASEGSAYSKVVIFQRNKNFYHFHSILNTDITFEIQKFSKSLENTKDKLLDTIQNLSEEVEKEIQEILYAQISMLDDPTLVDGVKRRISNFLESAPLAVSRVIESVVSKLETLENPYFKERSEDIKSIGRLIEDELIGGSKDKIIKLSGDCILVANELSPIQAVQLDKSKIKGFITEKGGITGHLAIMARNYGIPAIIGVENAIANLKDQDLVYLDGNSGLVIKNPDPDEILDSVSKNYIHQTGNAHFRSIHKDTYTKDGVRINIKLNLEDGFNLSCENLKYIDGVGLFRSESLIYKYGEKSLTEEKQIEIYSSLRDLFPAKNVIIRAFDLGGDKTDIGLKEDNPFLGCRGIRYLLQNPEIFKKQIRAILRSNKNNNLYFMLPMVTSMEEVNKTKNIINESIQELKNQEISWNAFKLGAMFETPAFLFFLDKISEKLDFLSIGSNDLLQYTLAVDRNHPQLWKLNQPFHISFLRILKQAFQKANKYKIPMGICGEIASIPEFAILLIAMGCRDLSISINNVERIQRNISSISVEDTKVVLKDIMYLSTEEKYFEIKKYFKKILL